MENLLQDYPELQILRHCRWHGRKIGVGAYATIEEVTIPEAGICAAKKIHESLQNPAFVPSTMLNKASHQFLKECKLLASLEHPSIVKFYGICPLPSSRLPALIMERLHLDLHDLLVPHIVPSFILPFGVKCSILHNVACGLEYLHSQLPPIVHRDLSARNVVLNTKLEAKIVDLGLARIESLVKAASSRTGAPGNIVYMPPEVVPPGAGPGANNSTSIDIFSFGVLIIFTVSEVFPCNPLTPTYIDIITDELQPRSEFERRSKYMQDVREKLNAYGQLQEVNFEDHPVFNLIQKCLQNHPDKRPGIKEVLDLLVEATPTVDEESKRSEREKIAQAVQEEKSVFCLNELEIQGQQQQQSKVQPIKNLDGPYGVAINRGGEIVISEWGSHCVFISNTSGHNGRILGSWGDMPGQMRYPAGIALNKADNVYVTSQHKLQKFSSNGDILKCIGGIRSEREGEFDDPRGLAIYNDQLYVCDRKNHRIQVFDLDLNYKRSIGTLGDQNGELEEPFDVKFDNAGKMYIAEFGNKRVQVMHTSGQFRQMIGQNKEHKVGLPAGIHVSGDKVYVSDYSDDRIVVYNTNGEYITSIGSRGSGVGELRCPYCITSNGETLFVCDSGNNRVHRFDLNDLMS